MATTVVADPQGLRRAERTRAAAAWPSARRARRGRRRCCGRRPWPRSGCRPGRRPRSGRRPRRPRATTWLLVMTWPWRSSTKPEPVAPPVLARRTPRRSAPCWAAPSARPRRPSRCRAWQRWRRDGVDPVEAAGDRAAARRAVDEVVGDAPPTPPASAEHERQDGHRPATASAGTRLRALAGGRWAGSPGAPGGG